MRQSRNSDKLREFVKSYHLPETLFYAWQRLRNLSAHGYGTGGQDIATILRWKDETLSLFYSIIFATLNYKGQRTEYSLQGWPQQNWPATEDNETNPVNPDTANSP